MAPFHVEGHILCLISNQYVHSTCLKLENKILFSLQQIRITVVPVN